LVVHPGHWDAKRLKAAYDQYIEKEP